MAEGIRVARQLAVRLASQRWQTETLVAAGQDLLGFERPPDWLIALVGELLARHRDSIPRQKDKSATTAFNPASANRPENAAAARERRGST